MKIRIAIIDSMAQLIVRNLDPDIVSRLRRRAARNGRSVEAEHREILREALLPARGTATFKDHLLAFPDVGRDEDCARLPGKARRVGL